MQHSTHPANGKYIHPDTIELEMKVLPWVLNVVVTGAGHEYNVGLIVPDMKLLKNLATELNLSVEPKDLFDPSNPAGQNFKDLLTAEVQNHLKKTIGSYEIPRKFAFILEDFSVDNGMLTQTMKLKRQVVMEKYGAMLEKLSTKNNPLVIPPALPGGLPEFNNSGGTSLRNCKIAISGQKEVMRMQGLKR